MLIGLSFWILSKLINGYPSVLYTSGAEILAIIAGKEDVIRTGHFLLMSSFLLCIPIAVLAAHWVMCRNLIAGWLVSIFGTGAALFAAIGASVWVFFIPALQQIDMEQALKIQLFELMHRYISLGIGRFFACILAAAAILSVTLALTKGQRWWAYLARPVAVWVAVGGAIPASIGSRLEFQPFALSSFAGLLVVLGVLIWQDELPEGRITE